MTVLSISSNGGGAAINLSHSGRVPSRPQVGMTYDEWLKAEGLRKSTLEEYRREVGDQPARNAAKKAERASRIAARLLAEEAARQEVKKRHAERMGVKVSKGGTKS